MAELVAELAPGIATELVTELVAELVTRAAITAFAASLVTAISPAISPADLALGFIDRRAAAKRCACQLSGRVIAMEHEGLAVSVSRAPTEAVVYLQGAIDMSSVAQMSSAVEHLLVDAPPRVVLDLAGVTFCDSQGLGTLVSLSQKARMVQSVLVLTNVGDFLQRVLDVTGLRPALHIV